MDDGKVTITIEIDAELLAQVTEVLKPYGMTPEDAVVQFFEYCVDPRTQDHAIADETRPLSFVLMPKRCFYGVLTIFLFSLSF